MKLDGFATLYQDKLLGLEAHYSCPDDDDKMVGYLPHCTFNLNGRAASTAILFLLARGERSHWHRVDAVEIWHWHAGAPLKLSIVDGAKEEIIQLGGDIHADEIPQVIVPARAWQAAESTGDWTLVGCTVAPGFSFDGFELAPAGWKP